MQDIIAYIDTLNLMEDRDEDDFVLERLANRYELEEAAFEAAVDRRIWEDLQ